MENNQKILQEKGYINEDGTANINLLNALSGVTTINFVYALKNFIIEDEIEALTSICNHLSFLYNAGHDDEAVRFINILIKVIEVELLDWELVELVLGNDVTKHSYLYELAADFREIVEDFRIDAGLDDYEDGEAVTVAYGSAVPTL